MPSLPQQDSLALIYSRKDLEFVRELDRDLRAAGVAFHWDESTFRAGDSLTTQQVQLVTDCDVLLYVHSRHSNASESVAAELQAWSQRASNRKKRMIPLQLDGTPLPAELGEILARDFRGERQPALLALIRDLRQDEAPPLLSGHKMWLGLIALGSIGLWRPWISSPSQAQTPPTELYVSPGSEARIPDRKLNARIASLDEVQLRTQLELACKQNREERSDLAVETLGQVELSRTTSLEAEAIYLELCGDASYGEGDWPAASEAYDEALNIAAEEAGSPQVRSQLFCKLIRAVARQVHGLVVRDRKRVPRSHGDLAAAAEHVRRATRLMRTALRRENQQPLDWQPRLGFDGSLDAHGLLRSELPDDWYHWDIRGDGEFLSIAQLVQGEVACSLSTIQNNSAGSLLRPVFLALPKAGGPAPAKIEISWSWAAHWENPDEHGRGVYPIQVFVLFDNLVALVYTWSGTHDPGNLVYDIGGQDDIGMKSVFYVLQGDKVRSGGDISDYRLERRDLMSDYREVAEFLGPRAPTTPPESIAIVGVQSLSSFEGCRTQGRVKEIHLEVMR